MFGSKAKLSPMCLEHIPTALEIIATHDDDDAECAQETYEESLDGQFIFKKGNTILGLTGFSEANDIATISWTYIAEEHRRQGYGSDMLQQLIAMLKKRKFRKAYIQTSDYREAPWQPMLYGDAIKLYKKLGFTEEGYHPHYYEKDEGMLIFGMHLNGSPMTSNHPSRPNADGIKIGDIFLLEETEDSFAIDWHEDENETTTLTTEDVSRALQHAQSQGAKSVFISFPSTFSLNLYSIISNTGFREEVQLTDYYADGIHEIRYRVTTEAIKQSPKKENPYIQNLKSNI